MLEVGKNTYITTAEADEWLVGEPGAERWTAIDEERKEGYLKVAARHIESLRFAGRKHSIFQDMVFPRDGAHNVPAAVKHAQALEALALTDAQAQARLDLQKQGVKSISLGKASESYSDGTAGANSATGSLCSWEAKLLLWPYLLGSGAIV